MKVLVLFAVGALFGAVSCYESYGACFNREFSHCAARFIDTEDNDMCNGLKAQIKCTYDAAQECDMGFIEEAYKVQRVVNRACVNETDAVLRNYRRCYGRAVGDGHCIKKIDEILDRRFKEAYEGQKEACMQVDWFKRCMVTNVEDNCGGVSEDYFSTFLDPIVALHKRICREVISTMDEHTNYLTVYLLPTAFDMIIEIFTKL